MLRTLYGKSLFACQNRLTGRFRLSREFEAYAAVNLFPVGAGAGGDYGTVGDYLFIHEF